MSEPMNLDIESGNNSDSEMVSASAKLGMPTKSESLDTIDQFFETEFDPEKSPAQQSASLPPPSLDLLDRMDRTYRLLDLIYEQGSGGAGKLDIFGSKKVLSVPFSGKGDHCPRIRWPLRKSPTTEVLHLHDKGMLWLRATFFWINKSSGQLSCLGSTHH
jgi:hypothetical protein